MKIALVIFITLALAGCALLSLHMGVIPVPWRALLTDWQAGREHYYVLMEYRLPRLLLALFVGAALAVAGVLIQGLCATLWHHRIFSALTMPPARPLWGSTYAVTARDGAAAAGLCGRHGGVDITEDAGKDPPADEAGAHRRGASHAGPA
ncbi:hypothetical protein ECZU26_33200 [Escherichia coli]|nr:hypothetical protein ECZU26_33200 [Escherichia coli]